MNGTVVPQKILKLLRKSSCSLRVYVHLKFLIDFASFQMSIKSEFSVSMAAYSGFRIRIRII
jgi:hypothetical protein